MFTFLDKHLLVMTNTSIGRAKSRSIIAVETIQYTDRGSRFTPSVVGQIARRSVTGSKGGGVTMSDKI